MLPMDKGMDFFNKQCKKYLVTTTMQLLTNYYQTTLHHFLHPARKQLPSNRPVECSLIYSSNQGKGGHGLTVLITGYGHD